MDFLKKLGQNAKRIRETQHLTQAELAELADVSVSTIARLELGDGFLTFKTVEKVASALKIEIEELFDVFALNYNNVNQELFVKELTKLTQNFNEKDLEFILEIIESYKKTKK